MTHGRLQQSHQVEGNIRMMAEFFSFQLNTAAYSKTRRACCGALVRGIRNEINYAGNVLRTHFCHVSFCDYLRMMSAGSFFVFFISFMEGKIIGQLSQAGFSKQLNVSLITTLTPLIFFFAPLKCLFDFTKSDP